MKLLNQILGTRINSARSKADAELGDGDDSGTVGKLDGIAHYGV